MIIFFKKLFIELYIYIYHNKKKIHIFNLYQSSGAQTMYKTYHIKTYKNINDKLIK